MANLRVGIRNVILYDGLFEDLHTSPNPNVVLVSLTVTGGMLMQQLGIENLHCLYSSSPQTNNDDESEYLMSLADKYQKYLPNKINR